MNFYNLFMNRNPGRHFHIISFLILILALFDPLQTLWIMFWFSYLIQSSLLITPILYFIGVISTLAVWHGYWGYVFHFVVFILMGAFFIKKYYDYYGENVKWPIIFISSVFFIVVLYYIYIFDADVREWSKYFEEYSFEEFIMVCFLSGPLSLLIMSLLFICTYLAWKPSLFIAVASLGFFFLEPQLAFFIFLSILFLYNLFFYRDKFAYFILAAEITLLISFFLPPVEEYNLLVMSVILMIYLLWQLRYYYVSYRMIFFYSIMFLYCYSHDFDDFNIFNFIFISLVSYYYINYIVPERSFYTYLLQMNFKFSTVVYDIKFFTLMIIWGVFKIVNFEFILLFVMVFIDAIVLTNQSYLIHDEKP